MAPDLSRRMFIGAAASSAAVALTANGSAAIGSEALRCIAFEPGKIPDKPDPTTQPALSKAWERMFESQLEWVAPDLCDLVKKGDLDIIVTPEVHRFLEAATTRYENSGGWCGASIVPDGGNQFVQIYGEFTVPEANIPPDGTNSKYYSATWIGLDGDRRYIDSTLPQVGTQQNTPGPKKPQLPADLPDYYAWFQWWAPRRFQAELWWIRGIPIAARDDVMALIWAIDTTHVVVVFCNFNSKKITSFLMAAPKHFRDNNRTESNIPNISGATAEWIVEDPSQALDPKPGDKPEPFADYKSVTFSHCVAGMADTAGPSTSDIVLTAPRFKRMYKVPLSRPSRTRFISMPKRGADTTELIVNYGGGF